MLFRSIDFLIERGHRAANIVWATGRRSDHTIGNITNLVRFRNKITLTILDDYSTVYLLPKSPEVFQKWYAKGTPISLIPVGDVSGLTTENLVYNLTDDTLSLGYRISSSNEVLEDGIVKISYHVGDLLMMECLD